MLKFQLVLGNSLVIGDWCTFAENFKYFISYEKEYIILFIYGCNSLPGGGDFYRLLF